jgi:hypothetical protein
MRNKTTPVGQKNEAPEWRTQRGFPATVEHEGEVRKFISRPKEAMDVGAIAANSDLGVAIFVESFAEVEGEWDAHEATLREKCNEGSENERLTPESSSSSRPSLGLVT